MNTRRRLIGGAIGAMVGAEPLSRLAIACSQSDGVSPKSLRILILGGTGYIGPHHVRAAVSRGHQVSVFNRGKSKADLPPAVERLVERLVQTV